MDRPRRRFRIHLDIDGDTWEQAGNAFAKAMRVLMAGDPKKIGEGGGYRTEVPLPGAGFALEINEDPKMTPEAFAELQAAYQEFLKKVSGEEKAK